MKDLIEIANFPTAVTVPAGDDFMDTLAEDLEAVFQVLANRTRYLKGFTDLAMLTNMDPASFEQGVGSNKTSIIKAAFQMGFGPHDDPDVPGARWSLFSRAKCVSPVEARMYAG